MERRDILKLLASATVLPALSSDALFWLQGIHTQIAKASTVKTLTPDQDATVTTIAELIIPQTDTPGAKAAKVNEFIDLILSDWYDDATTARFLAGLVEVDQRSQKLTGKRFVDASAAQQTQMMKVLDDEATLARKKQTAAETASHQHAIAPLNFFGMMKKLTLLGYYTSQIGFEDELHRSVMPAHGGGCVPISEVA